MQQAPLQQSIIVQLKEADGNDTENNKMNNLQSCNLSPMPTLILQFTNTRAQIASSF